MLSGDVYYLAGFNGYFLTFIYLNRFAADGYNDCFTVVVIVVEAFGAGGNKAEKPSHVRYTLLGIEDCSGKTLTGGRVLNPCIIIDLEKFQAAHLQWKWELVLIIAALSKLPETLFDNPIYCRYYQSHR